jgi:rhodanese-related sulfurtransferase
MAAPLPRLDIKRDRIEGLTLAQFNATRLTVLKHQLLCRLLVILPFAVTGLPAAFANDGTLTGDPANRKIVSPETIDGVINVDADGLIEKFMEIETLVLIDSRITADRKEGYIEGSVSLPDIETTCDALGLIMEDSSTTALFYCNGVKCGRSARAAQIALDCGYTEIYWYRNGMEEWQEKQYPLVQ